MKLIKITEELESLPEPMLLDHYSYSGLLKSSYKGIVNCTFSNLKKPSIFSIRHRIKNSRFNNYCAISTTLKLSIFLLGFIIALV